MALVTSNFTDFDTIITTVGSSPTKVLVDNATLLTVDVPVNISTEFIENGSLKNPSTSKTIKFFGPLEAPVYQNIFGTATAGNLTIIFQKGSTLFSNAYWFGAVADTVFSGTAVTSVGQDNHSQIERAIEAAREITNVWLPPSQENSSAYRTTAQIDIELSGVNFKTFHLFGGDSVRTRSAIYGDMTSGSIINIQDSRGGSISNVFVFGKNRATQVLDTLTLSGTVSVTAGTTSVTGIGTSFQDDFEPGQIMSIPDANGIREDIEIQSISSQTSLTLAANHNGGATANTYQKLWKFIENHTTDGIATGMTTALSGIAIDANSSPTTGSKQVKVTNCLFRHLYVGFASSLAGNVQGDTSEISDCIFEFVAIGFVSGNSQSRGSTARNNEFNNGHTVFNNVDHGDGQGSFWAIEGARTQIVSFYQILNASTSFGGTPLLRDVYCEFTGRIGECLGGNNSRPLAFYGCDLEFDPDSYKSDIELMKNQTLTVFEACTLDMNDYRLFYFRNNKRTIFKETAFRSDVGIPIIVTNQLSPNNMEFHNCTRYDNALDFREDLHHIFFNPKSNAGDYLVLQIWHRSALQQGQEENQSLRNILRTRDSIFRSSATGHDWTTSVGSVIYTISSGVNISRIGQLATMLDVNGNSVVMGEITAIDYGSNKITVTPLWHEWMKVFTSGNQTGPTPGNVYQYLQHYLFIDGMNGTIDSGDLDLLTVTDGSRFTVNDIVHIPGTGIRRVKNISTNDLTLHSNVTQAITGENVSDATV